MGNRLSKIVTRTGDGGSTGLGDGSRVAKDSPRIEAIGAVDELNSTLGLLLSETLPAEIAQLLTDVQHDLFDLGGELSIPGHHALAEARVVALEDAVERFNADLAPLREFILPGGTRGAGMAHVARTVCRRAERAVVTLAASADVSAVARRYLNRLSDLLFVLARSLNRAAGRADVLWQSQRLKSQLGGRPRAQRAATPATKSGAAAEAPPVPRKPAPGTRPKAGSAQIRPKAASAQTRAKAGHVQAPPTAGPAQIRPKAGSVNRPPTAATAKPSAKVAPIARRTTQSRRG